MYFQKMTLKNVIALLKGFELKLLKTLFNNNNTKKIVTGLIP